MNTQLFNLFFLYPTLEQILTRGALAYQRFCELIPPAFNVLLPTASPIFL